MAGFMGKFKSDATAVRKKKFDEGTLRYKLYRQARETLKSGINLKQVWTGFENPRSLHCSSFSNWTSLFWTDSNLDHLLVLWVDRLAFFYSDRVYNEEFIALPPGSFCRMKACSDPQGSGWTLRLINMQLKVDERLYTVIRDSPVVLRRYQDWSPSQNDLDFSSKQKPLRLQGPKLLNFVVKNYWFTKFRA